MSREINPLLQAYIGPHLSKEHLLIDPSRRPREFSDLARLYFKRWFVHPAKRHLTHYYSRYLQSRDCEIIGLTGSAGKTTTKEMVASVLSQKYVANWSYANIDPVYNIPTTVLRSPTNTKKLVLEMGIEFPGEMDFYLWLATPSVGVITNVYWTHTQFLGNMEGVAREKGKLIKSLPKDGYAILNLDDSNVREMAKSTEANVLWYSCKREADIYAKDIHLTGAFGTRFELNLRGEKEEITLPLLGRHFVPLALAAAGVGSISNMSIVEIRKGLERVRQLPHRMIPITLQSGIILLDDTYNANPLATIEAINVLSEVGKNRRKIFVLGEMKELGEYGEQGHREVGRFANHVGVDRLLTVGELTKFTLHEAIKQGTPGKNTYFAENRQNLISRLATVLTDDDIILIKGSRSMRMEKVAESICQMKG